MKGINDDPSSHDRHEGSYREMRHQIIIMSCSEKLKSCDDRNCDDSGYHYSTTSPPDHHENQSEG